MKNSRRAILYVLWLRWEAL